MNFTAYERALLKNFMDLKAQEEYQTQMMGIFSKGIDHDEL